MGELIFSFSVGFIAGIGVTLGMVWVWGWHLERKHWRSGAGL